jgi:hypothetical protein
MILDIDTYATLGVLSYSEHIEQTQWAHITARKEDQLRIGREIRQGPRHKASERARAKRRRHDPATREAFLKIQRESMMRHKAAETPEERADRLARHRASAARSRAKRKLTAPLATQSRT